MYSVNLSLLIVEFNPFTLKVIADRERFSSVIYITISSMLTVFQTSFKVNSESFCLFVCLFSGLFGWDSLLELSVFLLTSLYSFFETFTSHYFIEWAIPVGISSYLLTYSTFVIIFSIKHIQVFCFVLFLVFQFGDLEFSFICFNASISLMQFSNLLTYYDNVFLYVLEYIIHNIIHNT